MDLKKLADNYENLEKFYNRNAFNLIRILFTENKNHETDEKVSEKISSYNIKLKVF